MRRHLIIPVLCLSFLCAAHPLWSDLLPDTLGDWKLTERKTYPGQTLYDYINGGADVYYEYGFSTVDVGYYSKSEREILVEVYTMSSPQAAAGIYSFFRRYDAPSLPEPYTGKLYDFHVECLNGSQYIKLINYDSLGVDERLALLKDLTPKPTQDLNSLRFDALPEKRLQGSEVYFNGFLALKNFAGLGRKNFFGTGERAAAYGCLIEIDGKQFKWVTICGDSLQIAQDSERFLAFQRRNDYTIEDHSEYRLLADQLTGNYVGIIQRGNCLHFVFGFRDEEKEKIINLITSQK
ncbi:MAG: hypothetical protein JSV84_07835 [Gemmatimonadota bacterium]|nr:MAG: hypothetical protein JSV84_07835 [Gemmatimonadota bacterium]